MKYKASRYLILRSKGVSKFLLSLFFAMVFLSFRANDNYIDFSGKWHAETATASFDLKLTQIKGRVSGSHCAIQLGGRKVDCVMDDKYVTITGTANNSASMLVTFISQFYQKKGTASITKINDSTIQWKILSKPKGEYYLPNQMVLRRR
jgi:hypothetical protein